MRKFGAGSGGRATSLAAAAASACHLSCCCPQTHPCRPLISLLHCFFGFIIPLRIWQGFHLTVTGSLGPKRLGRTLCRDLLTPLDRLLYFCSGSEARS